MISEWFQSRCPFYPRFGIATLSVGETISEVTEEWSREDLSVGRKPGISFPRLSLGVQGAIIANIRLRVPLYSVEAQRLAFHPRPLRPVHLSKPVPFLLLYSPGSLAAGSRRHLSNAPSRGIFLETHRDGSLGPAESSSIACLFLLQSPKASL